MYNIYIKIWTPSFLLKEHGMYPLFGICCGGDFIDRQLGLERTLGLMRCLTRQLTIRGLLVFLDELGYQLLLWKHRSTHWLQIVQTAEYILDSQNNFKFIDNWNSGFGVHGAVVKTQVKMCGFCLQDLKILSYW